MILYIDTCVRSDSRTRRIASALLEELGEYEQIRLTDENLSALNEESLRIRTELIEKKRWDDPMLRYADQFANADEIVIAAPFWDYGFPALLKIYLENIYVTGLVSRYGEDGRPVGLCRAKKLWYVTTAGGPYLPDFSYDYVSVLAKTAFGIPETELISAQMLDVDGFDAETIVEDTIGKLRARLKSESE